MTTFGKVSTYCRTRQKQDYLTNTEADPAFAAQYANLLGTLIHSRQPNAITFEQFLAEAGAAPIGNSITAPSYTRPASSTQPAPDTIPAGVKPAFADYLQAEHREQLLPFLKEKYMNARPAALACMLFALADLSLLTVGIMDNQTELHKSLECFGGKCTRQGLNTALNRYNAADEKQRNDITTHKKQLLEYLKPA